MAALASLAGAARCIKDGELPGMLCLISIALMLGILGVLAFREAKQIK